MPRYETGDYVKAEFSDQDSRESEWMWVRVDSCDDSRRLVFGRLDSIPLLEYGARLKVGSQLAVSFDKIREHKKPSDFRQA